MEHGPEHVGQHHRLIGLITEHDETPGGLLPGGLVVSVATPLGQSEVGRRDGGARSGRNATRIVSGTD